MGKLNWFGIIATLSMVGAVLLLVLGETSEALVVAVLTVAAAILAHLR